MGTGSDQERTGRSRRRHGCCTPLTVAGLFGIYGPAMIIDRAQIPRDDHARRQRPCLACASRIAAFDDDRSRRRSSGRSGDDGLRQTDPHSAVGDVQTVPEIVRLGGLSHHPNATGIPSLTSTNPWPCDRGDDGARDRRWIDLRGVSPAASPLRLSRSSASRIDIVVAIPVTHRSAFIRSNRGHVLAGDAHVGGRSRLIPAG